MHQNHCGRLLDFTNPSFIQQPAPFYHNLRQSSPIHRHENGLWYLSRYVDVSAALNHSALLRSKPGTSFPFDLESTPPSSFARMVGHWLVFADPPAHSALRPVFSHFFSGRRIEQLRHYIVMITQQLLGQMTDSPSPCVPLVHNFCTALPLQVICHILGCPEKDWPIFKDWSLQFSKAIDGIAANPNDESVLAATNAMMDYFRPIMQQKRHTPGDDLISQLIEITIDGKPLDDHWVLSLCCFFIWSGHDTTKNLLANGLLLLAQHPEQRVLLQNDPALIDRTIEEIVRFESPIQRTNRWAHEDIQWHDQLIPKGSHVLLMIGAANRDPDQFPAPDVFDITRKPNAHLSFGRGIHFCLGAMLARIEANIALLAFTQQFPTFPVDANRAEWHNISALRSLKTLNLIMDN